MEKQRAIVDTCFLQKIASQGKSPDNIKRILDNSDYIPVAHKYVVEQELGLHSYLDKLIKDGYIRTIEYSEFLTDDFSKEIYENQFVDIYNEIRNYLKSSGSRKQMPELNIPKDKTIYSHHMSGSSMGDVHMILMASFMRLPVFLSEDSDITLLRDIAKRRLSLSSYQLKIYSTVELLEQIAGKTDLDISHREFETIVKQVGEGGNWAKLNAIWHGKEGNSVDNENKKL
ncbi:MAG: hypothetical protein K6G63_02310 [Eubacterium sp.]|nr:hypothetical protein [Eubacterium sp.]